MTATLPMIAISAERGGSALPCRQPPDNFSTWRPSIQIALPDVEPTMTGHQYPMDFPSPRGRIHLELQCQQGVDVIRRTPTHRGNSCQQTRGPPLRGTAKQRWRPLRPARALHAARPRARQLREPDLGVARRPLLQARVGDDLRELPVEARQDELLRLEGETELGAPNPRDGHRSKPNDIALSEGTCRPPPHTLGVQPVALSQR